LQTCDVKGCYAGEQISDDMLAAMKSGKTLAVGFQNLARQTISVPMALARFDEAYRRIQ
jgi:invasion protein IalB